MVKMISPNGDTVEVMERKVERFLSQGYSMSDTKPEPVEVEEIEEVQEEDSHEEIEHEEEEA